MTALPHLRFARAAAVVAAVLTLAACGGNGATTTASAPVPLPAPTVASLGAAGATFTIDVPLRRTQYVSSATRSMTVALVSVNGAAPSPAPSPAVVALTSGAPNCTTQNTVLACTARVGAPVGTDVFTVSTYASTDGTGAALSTGTTNPVTIADNANTTIALTLSGVVAALDLTLTPPAVTIGTPSTATVSVAARDASGATIVGTWDRAVSVASDDISGAFTLAGATLTGSSSTATLTYNGATLAVPVTITASATGATGDASAVATIGGSTAPGAPVNVYALPVGTSYHPPAAKTDPAAFNALVPGFANPPPASALLSSSSLYAGNGGVPYYLSVASQAFSGTKIAPQCNCAVASTSTSSTLFEFIAVQTWPFYVGTGASSNLNPGLYRATIRSDDSSWLVLAQAPTTYAQPAGGSSALPNVSGVAAGTAWVSNPSVAPPTGATGSVTIAAASSPTAPDANLYWATLEYAELAGGQAELDYEWKPPGGSAYTQVTQAVVYGAVKNPFGSPIAGATVTVANPSPLTGTITVTSDANGFYGVNLPPFLGPQNLAVTGPGSTGTATGIAPGMAVRVDLQQSPAV